MSWHYRSPSAFPALFETTLMNAIARPDEQVVFMSYHDKKNAEAAAEKFRWFLWCIRSQPVKSGGLFELQKNFELRSQIKEDEVGFVLWIRARVDKMSEFERLNPELAQELRL